MSQKAKNHIAERQIAARRKLWPELDEKEIWSLSKEGWTPMPRLMPMMMIIMDSLAGKGFPVSRTYLELWSRVRDEFFLHLNRPEEMAYHAGFDGQRSVRTWKHRMGLLRDLGFISLAEGPMGDFSYAVIHNPYYVIKRAYLAGKVPPRLWQSLVIRANELSIFDLDDIDDDGKIIEKSD